MKRNLLPVLFLLISAVPAVATTAVSLSLGDLVKDADLIAKGRVVDSSTYYNKNQHMVYTRLKFQVDTAYKGTVKGPVTITLPGGAWKGVVQVVMGVPTLKIGEQAIVFLKSSTGKWGVIGLGQGAFMIDTATRRVYRRLNRVRLVGEEFKFPTDLPGFERLLKAEIRKSAGQK